MTAPVAPMMRPAEVARALGLSRVRVYALIRAGELPSVRLGGAIRIPTQAWEAWLTAKSDDALSSSAQAQTH